MNIFGLSDKGRHRAENQDSFDICTMDSGTLAVVCDGMGGAAAGLLASDMAAARFIAYARTGLEAMDGTAPEDVLRQATDAANRKIYHFSCQAEEYAGMGTTLVAGYFTPDSATLVNVGDSRAYRIARDGLVKITKDHSLVQQMVDNGELTPAQARRHPRRNIITRAVGSEAFVTSDIYSLPMRQGDIFLLCSDGLTNAVEEAELHRLILASGDVKSACESLIAAALENNARDNVTAIVIDPTGKETPHHVQ
jgi:protein phosphatase